MMDITPWMSQAVCAEDKDNIGILMQKIPTHCAHLAFHWVKLSVDSDCAIHSLCIAVLQGAAQCYHCACSV